MLSFDSSFDAGGQLLLNSFLPMLVDQSTRVCKHWSTPRIFHSVWTPKNPTDANSIELQAKTVCFYPAEAHSISLATAIGTTGASSMSDSLSWPQIGVRTPIQAIRETFLLYFSGPAHTFHLLLLAAAFWCSIYVVIETYFYYLNPASPPKSAKSGLAGILIILLVSLPVVLGVLSSTISHTISLVSVCAHDKIDSPFRWRKPRCPRHIFLHLLLHAVVYLSLLGLLLWRVLFSDQRTQHLPRFLVVMLTILFTFMTSVSVAIPCLLVERRLQIKEERPTNQSLWMAWRRSFQLTCRSRQSFFLVPASFLLLNMIWATPLMLMYSRGPLSTFWTLTVVVLSWMALGWNVVLMFVLYLYLEKQEARECYVLPCEPPRLDDLSQNAVGHNSRTEASWKKVRVPRWRQHSTTTILLLVSGFLVGLRTYLDSPRWMSSDETPGGTVVYNPARYDLVGAQCFEMLLFSAYAFHKNMTYGGACPQGKKYGKALVKAQSLVDELETLGVQKVLRFDCPSNDDTTHHPSIKWRFYPWILGEWIISEEWLRSIRSNIEYPHNKPSYIFRIAVHIRRGDITPCTGDKIHKYLPNRYYQDMIDKYMSISTLPQHQNKTVEVVIHSQDASFESLDTFRQRGYTVKGSGTPLLDVWKEFMTSDVFIMSQSGFSVAPALLHQSDGVVVFPPYTFFDGAPGWDIVSHAELKPYKDEVSKMISTCPSTKRFRQGSSGSFFVYRNLGTKEMVKFFNPN